MLRYQKKNFLISMLLEEIEEEEMLIDQVSSKKVHDMFKKRKEEGFFSVLIEKHLFRDEKKFREFFRLSWEQFNCVLNLIEDDIKSNPCNRVKEPISAAEKLAVTLRFMATGESFRSLAFAFRISQSYITRIVRMVLESLSNRLTPILLPTPTQEDMIKISKDFWKKWNFPNCVGAIDGKHIRIFSPKNSGTLFFNYKDFFSIVLLAIVDANCKFVFVDIGSYGKEGDSGIFTKTKISERINNGDFFPPNAKILNTDQILPYVYVGDEAFRLDPHMMRPYSRIDSKNDCEKKNFNYRLSRARRTTENSFGLLSQVFRVFYTPIPLKTKTVDYLVLSACCLQNLLRNEYITKNTSEQQYYNFDPNDSPTNNMIQLEHTGGYGNYEGFIVRDELKKFFNSPQGTVPWQNYETLRRDIP